MRRVFLDHAHLVPRLWRHPRTVSAVVSPVDATVVLYPMPSSTGSDMRTTRALAASFLASLLIASSAATAPASVAPSTVAAASTTTARVTKVVDGDTIRTTKGTIRLIGVDTPERGRCNADRATAKAKKVAPVGSKVTLTRVKGENNTDRYGRYLRYVSRNGVDLGGAQIKAGLADARYDSRDGYPRHPKQGNYRLWDAKYPDKTCSSGSSTTSGAHLHRVPRL